MLGERFEYHADIKKQLSGTFSRKSTKSCVHYNPEIDKTGKKWGKPHFMGKKWGSLLFACQPISEPGIKPSSLIIRRHKNIAHFYLFFKSNGEFPGKKIPPKNEFCKRLHRSVRLCKFHFLYQERTEAVSLKLTNFIPSTSGVSSPE